MKKALIAVVALLALSWLFWRSVQSSLSEPYVVRSELVSQWRLVFEEETPLGLGLISLRLPDQFRAELFQQIFSRTMESMRSPVVAAIPVVLQSEFREVLSSALSMERIHTVATEYRLSDVKPEPVCIGVMRRHVAGNARQLYFALFRSPEILHFRTELEREYMLAGGVRMFKPSPFSLVVPLAGSGGNFLDWWPVDVNPETDCQAPLELQF